MLFGNNVLRVAHASGFVLSFTAIDALRLVDRTHDTVKVQDAGAWSKRRFVSPRAAGSPAAAAHAACPAHGASASGGSGVAWEPVRPYDWTYTTSYAGTLDGPHTVVPATEQIDLERLKRRDPIIFFDSLTLYEDELHDNGVSVLDVKIVRSCAPAAASGRGRRLTDSRTRSMPMPMQRVMPTFFLILMRFYLCVDDVLVRIRDVRIFHDFATTHLLREQTQHEDTFAALLQVRRPCRIGAASVGGGNATH